MEPEKQNTQVHIARSMEPTEPELSEATTIKHERSLQAFPELNLSRGEYVVLCIMKHRISLVVPMGALLLALVILLFAILNMDLTTQFLMQIGLKDAKSTEIYPILGWLIALTLLIMYATYYVYTHNRFILTNESIIQETQKGLLNRNEQTISLDNVEDASYSQKGLIQQMFNYGSLRLSTEGDETTYRFNYVYDPRGKIAILNNAVEAFKSGHPIRD